MNWGYYIFDDWQAAQFTLSVTPTIADILNAYATSLDELAWFALLFLFEAETCWMSDEAMTRWMRTTFVGIRILCYAFLLNTVYAYSFNYYELTQVTAISSPETLCDLVDQGFSFVRNLEYTAVDVSNCGQLSSAGTFHQIGMTRVITDASGLAELKFLYGVDIEDAIVWLAVVLVIEFVVLLQEKSISGGRLINISNIATVGLYCVLLGNAAIWIAKGHWVYGWDQLLWIGGFAAIEMNLSDWRDELRDSAV